MSKENNNQETNDRNRQAFTDSLKDFQHITTDFVSSKFYEMMRNNMCCMESMVTALVALPYYVAMSKSIDEGYNLLYSMNTSVAMRGNYVFEGEYKSKVNQFIKNKWGLLDFMELHRKKKLFTSEELPYARCIKELHFLCVLEYIELRYGKDLKNIFDDYINPEIRKLKNSIEYKHINKK